MLRFFEPEVEPRWPVSAAPPELRLPSFLPFPWESLATGIRNDAVFPLLSSSTSASLLASGNNESWGPSSDSFPHLERFCSGGLFVSSEDCNILDFQTSPPTAAIPTNPLDRISENRDSSRQKDAADSTTASRESSQQKAKRAAGMSDQREQKRQKTTASLEKPLGQLGASQPPPPTQREMIKGPVKRSQKLGDKVTALQQLVSPFGKTDTASVLHEATVCIKALHEQIQMLTGPYSASRSSPGLQGHGRGRLGLHQRGLCLVPLSPDVIDLTNQAPADRCTLERMPKGPGVHLH